MTNSEEDIYNHEYLRYKYKQLKSRVKELEEQGGDNMWYQDKNHKNSVASLHSSDWGWILRFYWVEYKQRNETLEPRHDLINKFIYLDKNEALRVLENMNYIESGF